MAVYDRADFCKVNARGVEGAAPYNATQYTFSPFYTNCDEIGTGGAVIIIRQPVGFPLGMLHGVSLS